MWRGISLAIVAYAKTVLEGRYGGDGMRTAKRGPFHFLKRFFGKCAVCPHSTKHLHLSKSIYIIRNIYIVNYEYCILCIMMQDSM